jgi:fucose permease
MVRDRLTWLAYALLAWFAYLQAVPSLVVPHLRQELDVGYAFGGLYVAAFAGGSTLGGLVSPALERALGRRALLWTSPGLMAAGATGLTLGRTAGTTLGAVLVLGMGGGLLLSALQAALADHHGERRAEALAEANVAAALGYLGLVGGLSAAALVGTSWRTAILAPLVLPAVLWLVARRLTVPTAPRQRVDAPEHGRLPVGFWLAVAVLMCVTAVEWTVTAWGATYVEEALEVSADDAVSYMAGYFGGFVAGRVIGSRLARRMPTARLLAGAIGAAMTGFAVLWTATGPAPTVAGLLLLGLGVGNLFPTSVSLALGVAPDRSDRASGLTVAASAGSILLAPVTVGTLADATSVRGSLLVVPVLLGLAAAGLFASRGRASSADDTYPSPGSTWSRGRTGVS